MKKLFISLGLAAAGTASLQAAYAPDLNSMQTTKIWSTSATLRGFYDDNYTTSPNGNKQGSAGFEVSPSLQLNVPLQQTEIGLKYTYGLYYYQERQDQGNDPVDQSHQVDLWLDHAFTERVQGTIKDTLAIGQEPTLLNPGGGPVSQPYRVDGNNLANYADVSLTTDWTREFSTVTMYNNGYYDYENDGGTAANPSLAALLNRIDQSVGTDFRWAVSRDSYVLIGYQFEWVNYTAGEPIGQSATIPFTRYYSSDRNYRSHIGYLGYQSMILPNLNFSVKAGAQGSSYYNDDSSPNFVTPYVVSTASYTYAPGSYVQLGVQHMQNATDIATVGSNGNITQSQQSTVFSASVNHQITAKLLGSVIGTFQSSRYNQGAYNNNSDYLYSFGANLSYAFNQHFSTEIGYNFDDLQSNVPGTGYSRNRVYLGVTAAY
ncbi:MAG: outer membrane beta-barrel protein [Limisphaerales bacterium]